MKKIIFLLLVSALLVTQGVCAREVGEKIGEAVYSDLTVSINNHPISAYNVNNYAVIVAEELVNYCYDVVWDGEARTLNITKSGAKSQFTAPVVYKTTKATGEFYADVLHTDIRTYVNGTEVTAFNIDGRTMIVADELGGYMDSCEWLGTERILKIEMKDKPMGPGYVPQPRTKPVYYGKGSSAITEIDGWHDFDYDGINEYIDIDIISPNPEDTWDGQYMMVEIGEKNTRVETTAATIDAVYTCDIDSTDGVKELVIITTEVSSDPVVRIFKYDDYLPPYKFLIPSSDAEEYVDEELWIGYVGTPYFNVNEDGTLTITEQTSSTGMWYVNKTYFRNEIGVFEEKVPEYYDVLTQFMTDNESWDKETPAKEKEMWKKGYIKAYEKCYGVEIEINKGEYFRVIADDGNNFIFIQKENGEAGWLYIGIGVENLEKLNPRYFFLAG